MSDSEHLVAVPGRVRALEEAAALATGDRKTMEGRLANVETAIKLAGKMSFAELIKVGSVAVAIASAVASLGMFAVRSESTAQGVAITQLDREVTRARTETGAREAAMTALAREVSRLTGRMEERTPSNPPAPE